MKLIAASKVFDDMCIKVLVINCHNILKVHYSFYQIISKEIPFSNNENAFRKLLEVLSVILSESKKELKVVLQYSFYGGIFCMKK